MTCRSAGPAARLRGMAAGTLTAVLAPVAHAAAGAGSPSGAAAVQLALLALVVGGFAATVRGGERFCVLVAVMAVGQLLGHVLLGTASHHHGGAVAGSTIVMLVAHAAALAAVAALVTIGEYLCHAVSRAVCVADSPPRRPIAGSPARVFQVSDQPLRSALQLAASLSHRGPPVSPAR